MARRLRANDEFQEMLASRGAGFAPDGLGGSKTTFSILVPHTSFPRIVSRCTTQFAHINKSIRGDIGGTSVPAGSIAPTSADHVAAGRTLDDIRVSTAAWKIL